MTIRSVPSKSQTVRLRLTKRGRLVIGVLVAALLMVGIIFGSVLVDSPAEAGATPANVSFNYLTVASGESLWGLAEWIAPDEDPREVVAALVSLNRLSSTAVQPGQRLAIPHQYLGVVLGL